MNQVQAIESPNEAQKAGIINKFCETYGEGYQQRKKLLSRVYMEDDENAFTSQCADFYKNKYDFQLARFDPLDMSKQVESYTLCKSLYDLTQTLK